MNHSFLAGASATVAEEGSGVSIYRDKSPSYREFLSPEEVMEPRNFPRILVIDDDPTFGRIMQHAAALKHVNLTFCTSPEEMAALQNWQFDVVVMDMDLGAVTGYELTRYLEEFTIEPIPVVLVSQSQNINTKHWPSTIREFVHKGAGPFAILDASFEAHEVNMLNKNIAHPDAKANSSSKGD